MSEKWDKRFLDMAKCVSEWSKDPSTQVGAVIVRPDYTIVSVGFNGFPMGMDDDERLYADRAIKMDRIVHAEMNAILFNNQISLVNCTLYTYPFLCCSRCAAHVIQVGITRVVAPNYVPARWREALNQACEFFDEANVEVKLI